MGIQGLLPALKEIQKQVHLSEYSGQVVAVDGYCWLHRAAFGCAYELAKDIPTKKYVKFCMNRVKLLQNSGILPLIVLDGQPLPMKRKTEIERQQRRLERKQQGLNYEKVGEKAKALECFQTCIDITPQMAYEWIKELKRESVPFIVAPYEADSQLAYLSKKGIVSAVITEDSDLLAFGCQKVIYKLGADGNGIEISLNRLGAVKEMLYWNHDRFLHMCILSGCDYLTGVPGIGVKTAMKHLKSYDAYTLIKYWERWGTAVKAPKLPEDYVNSFELAEMTFKYQRVYDPESKCLVHLNPIPENLILTEHVSHSVGANIEPETAQLIATGVLDPLTLKRFVDGDSKPVTKPPVKSSTTNFVQKKIVKVNHVPLKSTLFPRYDSNVQLCPSLLSETVKPIELQRKLQPITNYKLSKESKTTSKVTYFKGTRLCNFVKVGEKNVSPYFFNPK